MDFFEPTVLFLLLITKRFGNEWSRKLRNWKIDVRKLEDFEERWKANFLDICAERRLLPPKEKNDAHIIAETAVARIPILVTSDGPLLKVDTKELNIALADGGLHGV